MYDHDRIVDDDVAGEAYYDLLFVPGLTHETVQGGFAVVPQTEMFLTIPSLESEAVFSKNFMFLSVFFMFYLLPCSLNWKILVQNRIGIT